MPSSRRRRLRQIDDAVLGERPAVVDAHHHLAAVLEIDHAQPGAERPGGMRRGQRAVVERFAARRLAVEVIPRRASRFGRAVRLDRVVGLGLGRMRRGLGGERRFMMAERFARGLLGEVRALHRLRRGEIARRRRRLPGGDGDPVGQIGRRLLADIECDRDAYGSDRQGRDPGRGMHIVRKYARDTHVDIPRQPSILQGLTREGVGGFLHSGWSPMSPQSLCKLRSAPIVV